MLDQTSDSIIQGAMESGWVLEPDAKRMLSIQGLDVPESVLTHDIQTAQAFLKQCHGPVVAKAVSSQIIHKTEYDAVVTRITTPEVLETQMARLLKLEGCSQVIVEEMVSGVEVLVGAKNDHQFGPVVVFGIGGTAVEIYNDTAIRMAPLKPEDVISMVESLKGKELIIGFRGQQGVNIEQLTRLLVTFSSWVMAFEDRMESVDLNPVICTKDRCVIADARIILQSPDA